MPQFHELAPGGESDMIAPDPADPDLIYGGRVERLDRRTEQTRLVDPTLAYPSLDRGTWTLPLIFSTTDPHRLYFANQRLFVTVDGGGHWQPISPDLTREAPPSPPNLDAADGRRQSRSRSAPRRHLQHRAVAHCARRSVGRHRRRFGLAQRR